jgi:hypothetical protein
MGKYDKKKRVEVSCKNQPVCEHIYLHRFRKTCATRRHDGIPLRTMQAWLGHKDLATTQNYVGVADSDKPRSHINAAFGDEFPPISRGKNATESNLALSGSHISESSFRLCIPTPGISIKL